MIKFFRDDKYKYTILYFLKPFFFFLILSVVWFCAWGMWTYYNIFWVFDWLKLFVIVIFVILFYCLVMSVFRVCKVFFYCHAVIAHESDLLAGHVAIYEGAPGTGKTASMTYDSYVMSQCAYNDFLIDYYINDAEGRKINYKYETMEACAFHTILKQSYDFYKKNKAIPCLFGNYAIKEKGTGLRSYKIDKDSFSQVNRLAESSVIAFDESADSLSCNRVYAKENSEKKENEMITEFLSKERHFLNAYLNFAEQDADENYISLRRVVYRNLYLHDMEKVCQPIRLLKRRDRLRNKILKKGFCSDKLLLKYSRLVYKIRRIGFLKIYYEQRGNSQKSSAVIDSGWYALPCNFPVEYKDRFYIFDYKALGQPLKPQIFDSDYYNE